MIQHWRVITEKANIHCKLEGSLQGAGTMNFSVLRRQLEHCVQIQVSHSKENLG